MKKFNIGIFGIMGILILVVFASGCVSSSDNNTSSSSSNGQSNSQSGQSASSTGNAMVKVIAAGSWSGSIGDSSGSKSVDGSGTETFPLAQDPGIVSVDFQKDNSKDAVSDNGTITPDTSTMTVQIIDQNGNVVATQSTSADAGVVSVSHTF